MTKVEYASARRSRTLIKEALLAELQEKDLDRVTVTDIVRRAGINRSTFYAHYSNIPGLMSEFEGDVLAELRAVLDAVEFPAMFEDPEPFLARLAEFLEADADLHRTLLRTRGSDRFLRELEDVFVANLGTSAHVPEELRSSSAFQIRSAYFCGGMISLCGRWLEGDLPFDLSEVTSEIARLIRVTSRDITGADPDISGKN